MSGHAENLGVLREVAGGGSIVHVTTTVTPQGPTTRHAFLDFSPLAPQ